MNYQLISSDPLTADCDCLVLGAGRGAPAPLTGELDRLTDGWWSSLLASGGLDLRARQAQLLPAHAALGARYLLVLGTGDEELEAGAYRALCDQAGAFLRDRSLASVVLTLGHLPVAGRDAAWRLRQALLGFDFGLYRYEATKPRPEDAGSGVSDVRLSAAGGSDADVAQAREIAAGVVLARELGNLPPNLCTPAYLAKQAEELAARGPGTSVEILDEEQMRELGMGALLAVAQGSRNGPRLIVLRYQGAAEDERPYALVGKGITFDTGGISLKPGKDMDEMKFDMCGAAGVLGAFRAVSGLGLPINLLAVVPAVENMPDGQAYRPGDVVTTLSGKRVEVLNTDAEGRLILCDALSYVQRFDPRVIIDTATLTGACIVALGHHAAGLMSSDDELAAALLAAGERSHDRAWRLPLWQEYQQQLDSPFADFSNLGGPAAGSITAGCFLARFVEDRPWAHLDVAGTAWVGGSRNGATGRPVGILAQYLADQAAAG